MALVEDIVATVAEASEGRRVIRVFLEIGADAAVVPDAIAGCFEVATSIDPDGPLAGAALDIAIIPGTILTIRRLELEAAA